VATTVAKLADMGIKVHCPALGGGDLTSPAGRMTMGVINAVAQFERDLLIERTQSGLKRAKAGGAILGRPAVLDDGQREVVRSGLAAGATVSALAKQLGTSRQTIMRVRDAVAGLPTDDRTSRRGRHERREPTAEVVNLLLFDHSSRPTIAGEQHDGGMMSKAVAVDEPILPMTREEYRAWVEQQPRGRFERINGIVAQRDGASAMALERSAHNQRKMLAWLALRHRAGRTVLSGSRRWHDRRDRRQRP
jgi:Resolvase, N terminal domain